MLLGALDPPAGVVVVPGLVGLPGLGPQREARCF
jgi:hypothetical protein